ncbi:ATP-binding protein [Agromyces mediolanus]|nr:sensor histidine kinase [Agromyces mediolanus]
MGRSMSLRMQLLLLQVTIVLATVVGTGLVAALLQEQQLRESYEDRMVAVAQSVASLPVIIDAFDDRAPSRTIQPIAEVVREASDVTYVVVANEDGIRYSHPDPERIGERVSTDPSVPLSGRIYVGTQTGTLGESWRVKVPIFGADGTTVIGQVSVGILESELREDFLGGLWALFAALVGATLVGVLGSAWIGGLIRRRIYGLEPDEIRALLETREAMLHGIREGLVALDGDRRIVLVNDAAARLLGVEADAVLGRTVDEVLDGELARFIVADEPAETPVLSGERVLLVHADRIRVDGREVGWIAILRDRTELETMLRELQGAQSLADDLRAQSHEFSNTLHVLGGLIELGQLEAATAFIERVGAGGALSSLHDHGGIADAETAALVLAKRSRAHELGIGLEVDAASHLGSGHPAADDIRTVVANLLDNAVEACVLGGGVRLLVRDDLEPDVVLVQVDDDGPGVPAERRAAIFQPDVSDKPPAPGKARRGIGLTIVQRIAQRLGGTAEAGGSPAGGARFTVRLPSARDRAEADA